MAAFLGLSGWPGWGHDPAACLIVDGKLIAAVEEEKLIRKRHAFGLTPVNAIGYCLAVAGLTLDDITRIGIGWNGIERYRKRNLFEPTKEDVVERFLPRHLLPRTRHPNIRFLDHHACHAFSAIWSWPNWGKDAAVLVLDGQGDIASGACYHWKDGSLRLVNEHPVDVSLGYLFEAGCAYSGFPYHQGGKLMALAALGRVDEARMPLIWKQQAPAAPFSPIELGKVKQPFEAIEVVDNGWMPWLVKTFGEPEPTVVSFDNLSFMLLPNADRGNRQCTVAATIQACVEESVARYAQDLLARTGESRLCYTGGVALNCKANSCLSQLPALHELTIPPSANDAGTALGAALILAYEFEHITPLPKMPFWGPRPSPQAAFDECRALGLPVIRTDDPAEAAAEIIASGGIVARCSGALEYGPRALGHRSFLSSVSHKKTAEHLNLNVKRREWWRPFGPSLTNATAQDLFRENREFPHMLRTVPVLEHAKERCAAVVHLDGSTRPQTVNSNDDPHYADLLYAVGRKGGLEAVTNTSFNAPGLPFAASVRHAIADAFTTSIDMLVIEDLVIKRGKGKINNEN